MRRSALITKLIILTVMLFAVVTIVALQPKINALKAENAALSDEIAGLQQANRFAQAKIDSLGSDESVIAVAREKLGFAFEDEIILIDRNR